MPSKETIRLAPELEYYAQHKPEWLVRQSGNYVVVKDRSLLGFYPTFEAAYRAGASTYGPNTDFLVKQVLEHEPVFFVF